jgi:hypothetical protein
MEDRHRIRLRPTSGRQMAAGVQRPKTGLLKKLRVVAGLLLLGLVLALDSLYQAVTTAQAFFSPLAKIQLDLWPLIIISILAGVVASLLLFLGGGAQEKK